jgi:hypothetical protein
MAASRNELAVGLGRGVGTHDVAVLDVAVTDVAVVD